MRNAKLNGEKYRKNKLVLVTRKRKGLVEKLCFELSHLCIYYEKDIMEK